LVSLIFSLNIAFGMALSDAAVPTISTGDSVALTIGPFLSLVSVMIILYLSRFKIKKMLWCILILLLPTLLSLGGLYSAFQMRD
jgi:hypothetical protein